MKQAQFKYVGDLHGRLETIHGKVTLKSDGKISINLNSFKNQHTYSAKYAAKQLAKEIVEADFKHEAVYNVIEDKVGLVKLLTEKTQDLKIEYLIKCKEWAEKMFIRKGEWLSMIKGIMYENKDLSKAFYEEFSIEVEWKKEYGHEGWHVKRSFDNQKRYHKANDEVYNTEKYIQQGMEFHVNQAEKDAINHYESSISKLSRRLNDKGITEQNEIEISSARVGQNFECYIKSGDVSVRAWTIIAAEDSVLMRPHYRYLVK